MRRFVEGVDRQQSTLFPECLEDWICEDNPVRVIDVFIDELDLADLRFDGVAIRKSLPVPPKSQSPLEPPKIKSFPPAPSIVMLPS